VNGLRVAILAGAVIMGGLIIANAFPSESSPTNAAPGSSPSPAATQPTHHKPSPTPTPTPAGNALVCGSPNGLLIAVENAADPSMTLASPAAAKLKNAGYDFAASTDVSDASSTIPHTIVFYRAQSDKHAAACMKKNYFPSATLKSMDAGGTAAHPAFSQTARLAVFLGQDYAAAHGG
jgi:LytR cell envelope-related transcriptional attenuator